MAHPDLSRCGPLQMRVQYAQALGLGLPPLRDDLKAAPLLERFRRDPSPLSTGENRYAPPDQDDTQLAAKIVDAMKEVDAADSVRKEKAIIAGRLLAEAQKRHPTEKAFEKFLQLAGGVQIRRAKT